MVDVGVGGEEHRSTECESVCQPSFTPIVPIFTPTVSIFTPNIPILPLSSLVRFPNPLATCNLQQLENLTISSPSLPFLSVCLPYCMQSSWLLSLLHFVEVWSSLHCRFSHVYLNIKMDLNMSFWLNVLPVFDLHWEYSRLHFVSVIIGLLQFPAVRQTIRLPACTTKNKEKQQMQEFLRSFFEMQVHLYTGVELCHCWKIAWTAVETLGLMLMWQIFWQMSLLIAQALKYCNGPV